MNPDDNTTTTRLEIEVVHDDSKSPDAVKASMDEALRQFQGKAGIYGGSASTDNTISREENRSLREEEEWVRLEAKQYFDYFVPEDAVQSQAQTLLDGPYEDEKEARKRAAEQLAFSSRAKKFPAEFEFLDLP